MATPTTKDQFKEYCLRTLGKPNKYINWYFNIIEKAMARGWNKKTAPCYVEKHHIVPRSLGGGSNINIVCLTAKEHFICHILLTKFTVGKDKSKMVWAVMCFKDKNKDRYVNSYLYAQSKLHIKHTEEAKIKMSNTRIQNGTFRGKNNPMFGKTGVLSPIYGTIQSAEHKEKRFIKIRGRKHTEDACLRMSKNRPKGPNNKKWFNNGLVETFDLPENKPDNYNFGRLKRNVV